MVFEFYPAPPTKSNASACPGRKSRATLVRNAPGASDASEVIDVACATAQGDEASRGLCARLRALPSTHKFSVCILHPSHSFKKMIHTAPPRPTATLGRRSRLPGVCLSCGRCTCIRDSVRYMYSCFTVLSHNVEIYPEFGKIVISRCRQYS